MKMKDMVKRAIDLPFEEYDVILVDDNGVELSIYRPTKVPKGLRQEYDSKKNFQIWLKDENNHFKPNHLRLMIDLDFSVDIRDVLEEDNVAEILNENDLKKIGVDAVESFEEDKESRSEWEERSEKALDLALQVVEQKSPAQCQCSLWVAYP